MASLEHEQEKVPARRQAAAAHDAVGRPLEALQRDALEAVEQATGWWGMAARLRAGYQRGLFPGTNVAALPVDLDLVIRAQASARAALGDAAYRAAWSAGQSQALEEAIAQALALSASSAP